MKRPDRTRKFCAACFTTFLLWAAPRVALSQAAPSTVLRQLYGDVAIQAQIIAPASLRVGAADAEKSLAVTFLARDVLRWADSATRVLDARRRGKEPSQTWQAVVAEPGTESGSLVIAKTIADGDTTISVLVADTNFEQLRFTLDTDEGRAFVGALRRAARLAVRPGKRAP